MHTPYDIEKLPPITFERHVLAALNSEGWTGPVELLRALAMLGEQLRERYEKECSYAWAGNSEIYKRHTAALERHIATYAKDAGLSLYIQGDCRGATVYVRDASKAIDDNAYSTQAQCLYYAKGGE
jgi:hypothetical protein